MDEIIVRINPPKWPVTAALEDYQRPGYLFKRLFSDRIRHNRAGVTQFASIQPGNWRYATPKEVKAFKRGCTNINTIKKFQSAKLYKYLIIKTKRNEKL
jgi:hypothetical protein